MQTILNRIIWIIGGAIYVLMASAGFVSAQGSCTPGANHLANGAAAQASGDDSGAIIAYTCTLLETPLSQDALVGRMAVSLRTGHYGQAVADANLLKDTARVRFDTELSGAQATLSAAPDDLDAMMLCALLLWSDARDNDAIPYYDAILVIDGQNAFAFLFRGSSLRYLGDILQPPDDFADALQYAAFPADAYMLIGSTYAQTDDSSQALVNLNQAIALDPANSRAYYFRGKAYLDERDYTEAVENFTHAIELDPLYSEPYYDRGLTYAQQGDYQTAITDFSRVIDINAQFRLAYLSQGVLYGEMGNTEASITDLARYVELNELDSVSSDPLLPALPAMVEMADGRVYEMPFNAVAGETLTVRAASANNRVDPLLLLRDPQGTVVAANDDAILGEYVSLLTYVAITPGIYTVVVTHSDGGFRGTVEVVVETG